MGYPIILRLTLRYVRTKIISADSYYINCIMYNLITNIVEALPKGRKLRIHVYEETNETVISMKDTGVGIPKGIQSKLFTPMFTTKSKGQGFGLAVVNEWQNPGRHRVF